MCILLVASMGVSAQGLSTGEVEAVADVATAFEAFQTLDSYVATVDQVVAQNMTMGTGAAAQNIVNDITQTGEIKAVRTETGYNIEGTLEQNVVSGMGQNISMTLGLIIVDDVLYARVDDISEFLATMAPEGWVNVNEDGASYPLLAGINPASLSQLYTLLYPMDEESVLSIVKAEADEIDGQAMRVFDIEYDTNVLVTSGYMEIVAESLAASAPGVDVEELATQMLESATLNMRVWIGEDDGYLHRMENELYFNTELAIQGMTIPMEQTATSTVTFSGFDEPLEIVAPEIGS
jgi:hypothetical protein